MNIKNAKDCDSVYLEDRFFDSVSFWQHAYERSEAEQSRLMDRIYELEQRNEALLAKLQSQNSLSEENTQVSAKRKTNGNLNARKKAKTQVNLQSQAPAMALETSKLFEQPEYMEECQLRVSTLSSTLTNWKYLNSYCIVHATLLRSSESHSAKAQSFDHCTIFRKSMRGSCA